MTKIHISSSAFDVANWKPVTPDRFIHLLADAACTSQEPDELKIKLSNLPDGRCRLVIEVELVTEDESDKDPMGPYLMALFTPMGGEGLPGQDKIVLLHRTSAVLAFSAFSP